jgi:hypothetical protein
MLEDCGGFYTTDKWWDCMCDFDYIHPRSQKKCERCKCTRNEGPDAHAHEVVYYLDVDWKDL